MAKPDLPIVTPEECKSLLCKPPVFVVPTVDFDKCNDLTTVYICEYEKGTEYTISFKDEDRPNVCTDCLYDFIRRPLFGRTCDIETFFVFNEDEEVHFPGCYSGPDQAWTEAAPHHVVETVPQSKFERHSEGALKVYVNTWNHLMGDTNNNPDMETCEVDSNSLLRWGSRAEVDGLYKGLMTTVSEVLTEETKSKLGARKTK